MVIPPLAFICHRRVKFVHLMASLYVDRIYYLFIRLAHHDISYPRLSPGVSFYMSSLASSIVLIGNPLHTIHAGTRMLNNYLMTGRV